jgi:predicted NAD/FAD-dependent oxidoreductase
MIGFNKPLKLSSCGIKFQKNSTLEWAGNESSKLRIGNNNNLELWTLQSSLEFAK